MKVLEDTLEVKMLEDTALKYDSERDWRYVDNELFFICTPENQLQQTREHLVMVKMQDQLSYFGGP